VTDELRHHWTLHLLDEDSARHEAQLAKHPDLRKLHETRVAAARKVITANAAQTADAQKQRRTLEQEIAALEGSLTAVPAAVRRLQERRLELARRRLERLEQAAVRVEIVGLKLAAIVEMIHFLHEQALAPRDALPWPDQVEYDLQLLLDEVGELGAAADEAALVLHELDAVAEPA